MTTISFITRIGKLSNW